MTGGSRSVPVGGAAVLLAGRQIVAKARTIAANAMEAAAADIEFADGVFTVAGTDRRMTIEEVAKASRDQAHLAEGMTPGLDEIPAQSEERRVGKECVCTCRYR